MIKVSVIIPCYNQEDYLKDAISSVMGDYKDFEIIVINDGSTTPDAEEIINNICKDFQQTKIIHQTNQGICAARNNAIEQAQGEYILPLDSDDIIKNEYLKEAVDILDNNPNIGIVYCDAEFFGGKTGIWNLKKPSIINMLIQNRIFNTAMFRKSDWKSAGGYKLKEGCEDWDFWLTILERGLKPYKINKLFFKYRKLPASRTEKALNFKNYFIIRQKIIKNHKNLYLKYGIIVLPFIAAKVIKAYLCRK